jgi:hypothetical protein
MADEQPQLEKAAEDYFRALPGLKYPQALADTYPRIVNKLFELKDNKASLRDYFESLTNDTRGKRAGFPFSVLMNLQDVREIMVGDANGFVADDTTKWVS